MNVLKPELVWVKGRCYRKLPIRDETKPIEEDLYTIERDENSDDDDDYDELGIKCENNIFWTTIVVPSALLGSVIGRKGATRKAIEDETKVMLEIPFARKEYGIIQKQNDIVIKGEKKRNVKNAYCRIDVITSKARFRMDRTHFVCFPMNHDTFKHSFLEFKNEVLTNFKGTRGLHESVFQNPNKLHLTVTTLVLLEEWEREKAITLLENYKDTILQILNNKPLEVHIKGIEIMNDDPSEVDVLYAKVEEPDEYDILQTIADKLLDEFDKAKYGKKENESVKLHVTLMNSKFRNDERDPTKSKLAEDRDRESFNAMPILKQYLDYDFGIIPITEIHLSNLHRVRKDGFYDPSGLVKLI